MSTISGASGAIDVNGIVSQLMSIERQPLQGLQKTLSGIQTRMSAWGRLQGALSAFQDAARALTGLDTWRASKATSGDETAVKATAGDGAVRGVYELVVQRLAQRQTLAGERLSGSDAVVGGGTLRVQLGTWDADAGAFTANPDRPEASIAIPENATAAQVRDAINAADAGVTASLVNDGVGTRLLIRSASTGQENAVRILVDDADGNGTDAAGLSQFAYDPVAAQGSGRNMTQTQAAQDALVSVSGLEVTSATNAIDDMIENVTVDLRKAGEQTVTVDVAPDTESMRKAVQKFVDAHNELNKVLADLTRYDPATRVAGPLQGNNTVTAIQRQVRSVLQATMGTGDLGRLADAGIEVQRDGSLAIKSGRLDAALANPSKLQTLFASSDDDASKVGIARRLDGLLSGILGSEGAITGATNSLRSRQQAVERQRSAFEDRLTLIEARLRRQYTALDSSLAQMNSAAAFLASRFGES
jgi:flagellar hook-associated protein 2